MALEFKLAQFAHPLTLLRLRRQFMLDERLSAEELGQLQWRRLKRVAVRAFRDVPYYRRLFAALGINPHDLQSEADWRTLPLLGRREILREGSELHSCSINRSGVAAVQTSGTSGERLSLLMDRSANALEFNYYWRYWGWAGYLLGDRFAEFSSAAFLGANAAQPFEFRRLGNRLLLNSLRLNDRIFSAHCEILRECRPRFLKGLPSVLEELAAFLERTGERVPPLQAVFCTGEPLSDRCRLRLFNAFRSRIWNSYGHMERTVAASDCIEGNLHIHSDYGHFETLKEPDGKFRVLGTSLHNSAMPLLRYEVGDRVEIDDPSGTLPPCRCGSPFPRISRVLGRTLDLLLAPDGTRIAGASLLFDEVPGIGRAQIIQTAADRFKIRIEPSTGFEDATAKALCARLADCMTVPVQVDWETPEPGQSWTEPGRKFRPIVPWTGLG